MPPISPIVPLCDVYFTFVCNVTLPHKWKPPMSIQGVDQYARYSGGPGMMDWMVHIKGLDYIVPTPNDYIWEASTHELHKKAAKDIGKICKDFCHKAMDKFKQAHDFGRKLAKIQNLKINACVAANGTGTLDYPALKDAPAFSAWEGTEKEDNAKKYAKAVVDGLSDQHDKWASKVTCPGLPLYPGFIVYPGPMAPPTPAIPLPIIAWVSGGIAEVTVQAKLKDAMVKALDGDVKKADKAKIHEACFDSIGLSISLGYLIWMASQMVMNVLGKGPVPSFAPPYVPVGPVVMGDNIAVPGHLAT